jgi:ArsR family transcriptional regulator
MIQRLRKLLDILGNETRCRILDLVANQPRFISEISRELAVGQQAILRHLEELEEFGLLASFEEEEDEEKKRKGRKRKYYEISPTAQFKIFINIGKDDLLFDLRTPESSDHFEKLNKIEEQIKGVTQIPPSLKKLELYHILIKQLEGEVYTLDQARSHALRLLTLLKSELEV